MGRITIDPKTLFDIDNLFGTEDLKLYGEVDVLGLKNYSYWYDDITERLPIMFGFNFPTFKLIDVLSLEAEYYKWPFETSYLNNIVRNSNPLPDNAIGWDKNLYKYDDWKWSLYIKKTVFEGFSVTMQLARDHMHETYQDGYPWQGESVQRGNQWYWRAKFCYSL